MKLKTTLCTWINMVREEESFSTFGRYFFYLCGIVTVPIIAALFKEPTDEAC